ncbi:uncharacterized protein LOC122085979 [Macadamia integrifolia]|uniref:uncharacterized protein LOC122085979 n=1 Tax=Macadamia integrifolia TaxID=60698 RepID=UPI001C4F15BB|nr:uncharacterized protein LOC122085979 [Macadamia integrifolia]
MALSCAVTALLFSLVLFHVDASSGRALLHGSVSCLDCKEKSHQLHGIRVLVGCDGVKKMAMAVTDDNGHFRTELPRDSSSKSSTKCLAKLLGGPKQLCSSRKTLVYNVVEADHGKNSFTIAKPLAFFTSCSTNTKAKTQSTPLDEMTKTFTTDFGPFKTINIPLPSEWGLAPTSDYIPIMPIIGIP